MLRITAELTCFAEATMVGAQAVLRNARRVVYATTGQRRGQLCRAVNDPCIPCWSAPGTSEANPQQAGWG